MTAITALPYKGNILHPGIKISLTKGQTCLMFYRFCWLRISRFAIFGKQFVS